jgi:F-type H+-transporting ATPase subunit b
MMQRARATVLSTVVLTVLLLAPTPALAAGGVKESYFGIPSWLWLPLNLGLFLFLLYRFVGRPISQYLETRRETIDTELKDAEAKLAEAERLRDEVIGRLERVEGEVREIRERAEADGRAEAEAIAEQAAAEEARFLTRVDDQIARRHAETRHRLARETAALTAQLAREILSEEMTAADRERVFARSLAALEALEKEA